MKIIDSHVHLGLNQFRITEEIKKYIQFGK